METTEKKPYQLLEENYNSEKHGWLKHGHDAFGNKLEPEPGYRILDRSEKVQIGDRHFDIYGGWTSGGEHWDVEHGHYANSGGRWRCWSRKI